MSKIFLILSIYISLFANERNILNDVVYKSSDMTYNMIVEIPTGTNEKWEVSKITGKLKHDKKNGKDRVVEFLSYPGNYGFIPQTKLLKSQNGDGDPIDILLLTSSLKRGSIIKVNIIGGLDFLDRGEIDTKLIAVPIQGILSEIDSLQEMHLKYPNILNIVKLWFEGYKGFGKMQFMGYLTKQNSLNLVEKAHKGWLKNE